MSIEEILNREGYTDVRTVAGRGLCGLSRFVFTVGLVYGIDFDGYQGRYCYGSRSDALAALKEWDGAGDPPGNWIKHKGLAGEYKNPKL